MWRGDSTFELSRRAGWRRSTMYGGMPEAETTFRGQLVIVWMKEWQTILAVCCIRCMMYSVYAVHSGNSWSWHRGIEMDALTVCAAIMVELWTKQRDGGWRWERYGAYELIWEIRGTTRLIGFGKPRIGVIAHRIGTCSCRIGDRKLTRPRNSLSPSFSWWFPLSPLISLFLILNSNIT